jgi:ADP-ribose pyrophosphatase
MSNHTPEEAQAQIQVLDTTRVYDGKIFKVDVEDVRLPSGRTSKREIVRHPGAVALMVVDPDGKLLLVRQYRRAADRILLEVPAGTREAGDDAETCAIRETQEETGYLPGKVERLGGFYSAPGFCTEYLECYLCTDLRPGDLQAEEDEDLQLERLSLDDAWSAAAAGTITDAKTLAGLLLYAARHPEARPRA